MSRGRRKNQAEKMKGNLIRAYQGKKEFLLRNSGQKALNFEEETEIFGRSKMNLC